MDKGKLPPHLGASNKQQQQPTIINGKITKAVQAEPRGNLPSNVHSFGSANMGGSAWSSNRTGDLSSNVSGPPVVKATPMVWSEIAGQASSSKASIGSPKPTTRPSWSGHAGKASSSKASTVSPKPSGNTYAGEASSSKASGVNPKPSWNEYSAGVSSSKASNVRDYVAAQVNLQDMPPTHLRGISAAATPVLQPTPPMNAGKLAKSAKHDSKVPCTYEDCTRGFTKETDMKRHKDEDHDWCRLCDVDCADLEALLEHKVQSDKHICCDFCGEDFRSDMGKERHMRQVRSWTGFQGVGTVG